VDCGEWGTGALQAAGMHVSIIAMPSHVAIGPRASILESCQQYAQLFPRTFSFVLSGYEAIEGGHSVGL
jgi:hypothetical protein